MGAGEMEAVNLWNLLLTTGVALLGWLLRTQYEEVRRLQVLLNRTREEVAKEYVTKAEVHADINRVLDRLDRLDAKLDAIIKENSHGHR